MTTKLVRISPARAIIEKEGVYKHFLLRERERERAKKFGNSDSVFFVPRGSPKIESGKRPSYLLWYTYLHLLFNHVYQSGLSAYWVLRGM